MKKILLSLLVLLVLGVLFTACGESTPTETTPDSTTQPAETTTSTDETTAPPEEVGSVLDGYVVVTPQYTLAKLETAVKVFIKTLAEEGVTLTTVTEDKLQGGEKTIVIGNTALPTTQDAKALLPADEENAYAITVAKDCITIAGSNMDSVFVGMKYFLTDCLEKGDLTAKEGDSFTDTFGDEVRIFDNLVKWELEETVVIDKPTADNPNATMKYPSLIELQYQSDPTRNGTLLATGERWVGDHNCPIYRSTDKGSTWETVTFVEDTLHRMVRNAFAPCLFELPYQVGEMPAGTIILGSDSVNSVGDWTRCYIVLYRSYDGGNTWEAFTTVAESIKTGGEFGVWEPNFVCTQDGTLIVYYADDSSTPHSQKLVYKTTKDGVNWSEAVETVASANHGLRPGMPVVTKMGNGEYMMIYEIVGLAGNPVYYKISEDPTDWGDPVKLGTLLRADGKTLAATPWVTWGNVGGEKGMMVATGWRMASGKSDTGSDIFVSFDYGNKWESIPNFYSYTWVNDNCTWGYSVSTVFSTDGKTMYYMANPQGDAPNTTWYTLFKITIS